MPEARAHAIVVGFLKDDLRRFRKIPVADIDGGRCISCSKPVFFNLFGVSAIREKDADVVCDQCERRYQADIDRALIES